VSRRDQVRVKKLSREERRVVTSSSVNSSMGRATMLRRGVYFLPLLWAAKVTRE
jgi:hypothetical protein